MLERSAGRPSAQAPAQQGGRKRRAPAISGGRPMTRRPGRRLSSSVEIWAVGFLLSPQSLSITTLLRRKNEDIPLICRFGSEGRIKSRRVFGSGQIAVFSKTTSSQCGQRGRQAIMEAISIAWKSGRLGTTLIARRRTTLSAQSNYVLQVLISNGDNAKRKSTSLFPMYITKFSW